MQALAESKADTDRKVAENEKSIIEMRKQIGGITAANGAIAEEAMFNALNKTKSFATIQFDFIRRNVPIVSKDYQTLTELDILMVNGDCVLIGEAKHKVVIDDVFELLNNKLTLVREYFPEFKNHKLYLGIGGMSFVPNAEKVAKENGIGIIKMASDIVDYDYENIKTF